MLEELRDGIVCIVTEVPPDEEGREILTTVTMEPYTFLPPHSHAQRGERYYLCRGRCTFLVHVGTHWESFELTARQPEFNVGPGEVHAISVGDAPCTFQFSSPRSHMNGGDCTPFPGGHPAASVYEDLRAAYLAERAAAVAAEAPAATPETPEGTPAVVESSA